MTGLRLLPRGEVALGGRFAAASARARATVLSLDTARLSAPFFLAAGAAPRGAPYGSWESSGLGGHMAGHALSALSLAVEADPQDGEARAMLSELVRDLAYAQRLFGTGYVGGVPGGSAPFDRLRDGGVEAARQLGSDGHWVPWYNLHKTFQGLIDAHVRASDPQALTMVVALAEWWMPIANGVDDATFEVMLDTEYGGMNDVFAQLAELTGRGEFADMAVRFSHRRLLEPLRAGRDELTGMHANTQIAKAVGYASVAHTTGDDEFAEAAAFFWRRVVGSRSTVIGGDSVREHFHPHDDFSSIMTDREGPESCNTANLLKLTRLLSARELRPEYLDFVERALYNHVLPSQHPRHGGLVYFTPMRPRHYRVYSTPGSFWCCVGSGIEVQQRYDEWIFGLHGQELAVNLYAPASARIAELGASIAIDTDFPATEQVRITVSLDHPAERTLRLRVPGWCTGLEELRVAGQQVTDAIPVPGAVLIRRTWSREDVVEFTLPLRLHAEDLPDGSGWRSFLAGPLVLASIDGRSDLDGLLAEDTRMGHVAGGELRAISDIPRVRDAPASAVLARTAASAFHLDAGGQRIDLVPFADLHDARYTLAWPVEGSRAASPEYLRERDAALDLDGATLDAVLLGEQQPETEHALRLDGAEKEPEGGRRLGGRLSLMMRDTTGDARILRVRVRGAAIASTFAVTVDGDAVGEAHIEADEPRREHRFVLPPHEQPRDFEVVLTPSAHGGTPVIEEIRILR